MVILRQRKGSTLLFISGGVMAVRGSEKLRFSIWPNCQASDIDLVFEIVEEVVRQTPDAQLRERLLNIRPTITANPEITLEQLRHRI